MGDLVRSSESHRGDLHGDPDGALADRFRNLAVIALARHGPVLDRLASSSSPPRGSLLAPLIAYRSGRR